MILWGNYFALKKQSTLRGILNVSYQVQINNCLIWNKETKSAVANITKIYYTGHSIYFYIIAHPILKQQHAMGIV